MHGSPDYRNHVYHNRHTYHNHRASVLHPSVYGSITGITYLEIIYINYSTMNMKRTLFYITMYIIRMIIK